MRKVVKRLASFLLVPFIRWYLRKERKYSYGGADVIVLPGVFHPGLFHSTKFLIDFIGKQSIKDKTLLELGCGTGLIAVLAAMKGAQVTASDLSHLAIKNTKINAQRNHVHLQIIHSDLFANLEKKPFDWIIINPPYYARVSKNEAELAWHCGENFEYFRALFTSLGDYMSTVTEVVMVLTLGSELNTITAIANKQGFRLDLAATRNVLFDSKDFLFRVRKISSAV